MALSGQLAELKPAAQFTEEQRSWLAQAFKAEEAHIIDAIRRAAVPSPMLEQMRQNLERIDGFIANPKTTVRHEYSFSMDFRNSKATATILIMGLAIILSLAGNIHQCSRNQQYRDNDLKYRFIKMHGGTTGKGIATLQALFGYERNERIIKEMRKDVEQFEQAVTEQAEKEEQARLNAIQAEQLKQEAERLKNKK